MRDEKEDVLEKLQSGIREAVDAAFLPLSPAYDVIVSIDDDGDYTATCPSFPSLSVFSKEPVEAYLEMQDLLREVVDIYKESGWELPKERVTLDE